MDQTLARIGHSSLSLTKPSAVASWDCSLTGGFGLLAFIGGFTTKSVSYFSEFLDSMISDSEQEYT